MKEDIRKDSADVIVVDGIRYPNELKMAQSFPENIMLFIEVPLELRYQRCCMRGTRGEASLTFEEFRANEEKETERHLDEIIGKADYTIDNAGTIEELREKVKEIVEQHL